MAQDFKQTVLLPKTDFPMKAELARREPLFLERWEKAGLYAEILKKSAGRPKFVLHDGPPYANGQIHLGTAMNKVLKDLVVKSKTMAGFRSPYLPGWDCHGLPIEHQVAKDLGPKARTMPKLELRKACRAYAERFIDVQRSEFRRLGVFGLWETPYRTMDFAYQAQIVREFARIVEGGYVYRSRRAIHWCPHCETALAEAEIEYADHRSPSVYVAYPMVAGIAEPDSHALIWTTTPWTLPASMAIAYSEAEEYVLVTARGSKGKFLLAKPLLANLAKELGLPDGALTVVTSLGKGTALAGFKARHPWIEREIPFLPGEHVTMDTGTGLVHTAPGHGEEDFELGIRHGIAVYSPVGSDGRFDDTVEHFAGLKVFEANPKIIDHLVSTGRLFGKPVEIAHAYPHCWRCKNPVIFRATEQWFLSLSNRELRARALEEIDRVNWMPKWGRERIYGMIEQRPDWCISRQRFWGVPIVTFRCKGCGEFLLDAGVIRKVADLFEREGADAWFARDVAELLGSGPACKKCGQRDFEKGTDILDVWFDSGASHAAVVERLPELGGWPCDLYLEGSDQHRGWFHSTLLEGMATRERSPFAAVITHGFVVDGEGRKMSKSLGNYISAQEIVKEKGAEMVRLWVATEDYRNDVRVSKEIMDRVVEAYRRIRNTARFCLGNLSDFDPDRDAVPTAKLSREVDRWAADRLARLTARCRKAYEDYEFHQVAGALNEFCVVDLSSFYLDLSKDVLYCDAATGGTRRSAQTLLFETARTMALFLAPILPMTAEEIWDHLPKCKGKTSSVHLADFPAPAPLEDADFVARWEKILAVRSEVSKVLEQLRKEKKIGQSLQARVEVKAPGELIDLLAAYEAELPSLFIVSRVACVGSISSGMEKLASEAIPGLEVGAAPIEGVRCERCWTYAEEVGKVAGHPTLCRRCAGVVGGAG